MLTWLKLLLNNWRLIVCAIAAIISFYSGTQFTQRAWDQDKAKQILDLVEQKKKDDALVKTASDIVEKRIQEANNEVRDAQRRLRNELAKNKANYDCHIPDDGVRLYNEAVQRTLRSYSQYQDIGSNAK